MSDILGTQNNVQKQRLLLNLMNQSQTYYSNNLNVFSNGLSLLALSSVEAHGKTH